MSLTASQKNAPSFPPLADGTYVGVCYMLVDLGQQISEKFGDTGKRILIGWEIPGETVEIDGEEKPRIVSREYKNSLNNKASLYTDLIAWRGREFTAEELEGFNLANIVGKPCMLNIINNENGYPKVKAVMAMPKGMPKPALTTEPVVFDIDESPVTAVDELPEWIRKKVTASPDFKARQAGEFQQALKEEESDGELPF